MSPISWVWLWRGLQGRSITFAALFGSLVMGLSISRLLHHVLAALGFQWLLIIVTSVVVFGWVARQEERWIPDAQKRRMIALAIILGSTAIAATIQHLTTGRAHPAPIESIR